jgi:hypothetical protein
MPFQFIQMVNPIIGSIPIAIYKSGNELAGIAKIAYPASMRSNTHNP